MSEKTNKKDFSFMKKEKEKGISNVRYPKELAKAQCMDMMYTDYDIINTGGIIENGEIIEDVKVKTDMTRLTLDGFKIFLGVCAHITNNNVEYKKYLEEKYKDIIGITCKNEKAKNELQYEIISKLTDNDVQINISFNEILDIMGKENNKSSKIHLMHKVADKLEDVTSEIRSRIVINNKSRIAINWGRKVEMSLDKKSFTLYISDLFVYYMLNDYVMLQVTKELYNSNNLGIMNLSMYMVSFKYNNRYSYSKNTINVKTVLKKIGKTKEEDLEKYKKMKVCDFKNLIGRTIKKALTKVDKDATFEFDLKRCTGTVASVIERGKVKFEIPVFKNGRTKYNKIKLTEKEEQDNEMQAETPFK